MRIPRAVHISSRASNRQLSCLHVRENHVPVNPRANIYKRCTISLPNREAVHAPPREPAQIKMCTPQPHPTQMNRHKESLAASAPSPFYHAAILDVQVQKGKCRPSQIIQFTRPHSQDSQKKWLVQHLPPTLWPSCTKFIECPRLRLAATVPGPPLGKNIPRPLLSGAQSMPPSYSSFRATSKESPRTLLCRIHVEGTLREPPSRTDLSANTLSFSLSLLVNEYYRNNYRNHKE